MQIYSLTEISFFKSEMHSFVAEAVFITAIRIQAAMIAGRYLVTHLMNHRTPFKNHIDDYVQILPDIRQI